MALVRKFLEFTPKMGTNCWLAENATIIGNVTLGDDCSVWYNAVLRGDVHEIKIGNKTNIQDGCMIHCTYERAGTYIGDSVTVGHHAILHACKVGNNALIGMGAIVLDDAEVGEGAIVAAGAVVKEKTKIPPYTLWAGIPAKQVKVLDKEKTKKALESQANNYVFCASLYEK